MPPTNPTDPTNPTSPSPQLTPAPSQALSSGPQLGDIVLLTQADGTQVPAIVTRVLSPTAVNLTWFTVGGSGGSTNPFIRGDQPGQWQPKPPTPTLWG
jgi:hypothetical protein